MPKNPSKKILSRFSLFELIKKKGSLLYFLVKTSTISGDDLPLNLREEKFRQLQELINHSNAYNMLKEEGVIQAILDQLIAHPEDKLTNENFVIPALLKLFQLDSESEFMANNLAKRVYKRDLDAILLSASEKKKGQESTLFQLYSDPDQQKPSLDFSNA